jgi:BNR repeat-like domain
MRRVNICLLLMAITLISSLVVIEPVAATQRTFPKSALGAVQNLSGDSGLSTDPIIASVGLNVYIAWEDSTNGVAQTVFVASHDGGSTWGKTMPFTGSGNATAVQIAATGSYVFLVWKQGELTSFAASSNLGASFGPTKTFSEHSGSVSEPSLATNGTGVHGTTVYLAWAFHSSSNNSIYSMLSVSHDGGATMSTPKRIGNGMELQIAAQNNYVYVIWDSIYITRSSNGGNTFSTPRQLKESGCSSGCLAREPMIAVSGSNVYVTWPSNLGGSYQAYIAVSNDYGVTWLPSKPITSSATVRNAREVQVATCSGSNNQVPCPNTSDVYVTFRGQPAGTKGINQFIVISYDSGKDFGTPLDLAVQKKSQPGFGGVAVDGNNVVVLWPHVASKTKIMQMWMQESQDQGVTWNGVQQVSDSTLGVVGMGDSNNMHDQGPMVSASGGNVYAVWQDNSYGSGDICFVAGPA